MSHFLIAKIALSLMTFVGAVAQAAIPPKPAPARFLSGNASQNGGMAGTGFTLLDVRRTGDAKRKIERVVMDVGDMKGGVNKGLPGYFHVEMQEHPDRLIIDLAQTPSSRIDEKKLARIFSNSIAVKKVSITEDPSDGTLNIALDLKKKTKVRVLQVPGQKQTSKIVLDMMVQ
jgi:hypothetical protein